MKRLALILIILGITCILGACRKDPKAPVPLDEPKQPLVPGSPQSLVAVEMPYLA